MRKLVIGILAHVDAGKTTLSEALLFRSGSLRRLGRVDNRDAFLDTYAMEKARGITIFSKQALLPLGETEATLLDTPGHVDFSAETERTLQVLDYAVLVVNGADGVQAHTETLWRLLAGYRVPVFLFVNKMDQPGTDRQLLLKELREKLDDNCVDFGAEGTEGFYEALALCGEEALGQYLKRGRVGEETARRLIRDRRVYPCYFGSALKLEGVDAFLRGLARYLRPPAFPEAFGATVFKISRDSQGNRLTHMKITGGSLRVRDAVGAEKVTQIRIYSGEKYETAEEAAAGSVCAVTGLSCARPGQRLGAQEGLFAPSLEPVLTYRVILPEGCDARAALPKLRELEEEDPQLRLVWEEQLQEIHVRLMGEVQKEILESLLAERFGISVTFGEGSIVYKETIEAPVVGFGHFEPLRHYAEVHLLLEPGEPGSGLVFASACGTDTLEENWQRLVLAHLREKEHRGFLVGAPVTDMKITLVAGRAHQKHTEGGDFRQAAYRAVRQGLWKARSVLLEPYYDIVLEVPTSVTGRAMTDLERMGAKTGPPEFRGETAVLKGFAPVSSLRGYQKEVPAYTGGRGRLSCTVRGYGPCHNPEAVLAASGYDPGRDAENPAGSVFCAHGAGFAVGPEQVERYIHVKSGAAREGKEREEGIYAASGVREERAIGTEEIDAILEKAGSANRRKETVPPGWKSRKGTGRGPEDAEGKTGKETAEEGGRPAGRGKVPGGEEYLLVDGYNIIFAWDGLRELAEENVDGARGKLLDILCNYQAVRGCRLIVVFDAYRVPGHATEAFDYHNIRVVYTKEAETADQYIEKFAHENGCAYRVTVATSDGLEQIIIRGQGCALLSARELEEEVGRAGEEAQREYAQRQPKGKAYLADVLPARAKEQVRTIFSREKENKR